MTTEQTIISNNVRQIYHDSLSNQTTVLSQFQTPSEFKKFFNTEYQKSLLNVHCSTSIIMIFFVSLYQTTHVWYVRVTSVYFNQNTVPCWQKYLNPGMPCSNLSGTFPCYPWRDAYSGTQNNELTTKLYCTEKKVIKPFIMIFPKKRMIF